MEIQYYSTFAIVYNKLAIERVVSSCDAHAILSIAIDEAKFLANYHCWLALTQPQMRLYLSRPKTEIMLKESAL